MLSILRKRKYTASQGVSIANSALALIMGQAFLSSMLFFWASNTFNTTIYLSILIACSTAFFVKTTPQGRIYLSLPTKKLLIFYLIALIPAASLTMQAIALDDISDNFGRSSLTYARNMYIVSTLWLICGAVVSKAKARKSNAIALFLVAIVSLTIANASDSNWTISYDAISLRTAGLEVSHLTTGDNIAMILTLAYCIAGNKTKIIIFIATVGTLFTLGGRSALYLLPAAMLIFSAINLKRKSSDTIWIVITIASTLASLLFFKDLLQGEATERIFFSAGLDQDASYGGRLEQVFTGIMDLPSQAAFGDPTHIIKNFGTLGAYIHNILSAWQFYGLAFFAATLFCIVKCTKFMLRARDYDKNPIRAFFCIMLIYTTACIATTKSIGFTPFWFTLGYWLMSIKNSSSAFTASINTNNNSQSFTAIQDQPPITPQKY